MKNNNRKEELNTLIRNAHNELYDIESVERRQENEMLVGNHYKYRSCHSCPKSEKDYWWLYARVDGLSENGTAIVFQFQTDEYGEISIEPATENFSVGPDWVKITGAEFVREWKKFKKNLSVKFGN